MDGVMYTGDGEGDDDDGGRRESEPARKRQNTGNSTQGSYHHHSSTYPPVAANRASSSQNNLRPYYQDSTTQPTNVSPKLAATSIASVHGSNQSNVFAQGGMTESPKPLSPGQQEQHRLGADGSLHGSRSPNMSQHLHQQSFSRSRATPPIALAPPNANNGPHLPSLPGLNALAPKPGSQSSKGGPGSLLQHQHMPAPGATSQPGSMSSHGGSGGSMRETMGNQVDVWQYVRDIEARMARMEKEHNDRISTMQNEITTLRAQLAQQQVQSQGH
jgi:hypothetical protein